MHTVVLLLIFCFTCLFSAAQAQPQAGNPSAQPQQQAPTTTDQVPAATITRSVDVVNVVFTVTNDDGKFVKDLSWNQFRVLDNNKPPQEITSFEAQTNLPLRVGLLIDASNSIRERFKFEQQAATEFLQQTVK